MVCIIVIGSIIVWSVIVFVIGVVKCFVNFSVMYLVLVMLGVWFVIMVIVLVIGYIIINLLVDIFEGGDIVFM